MAGVPSTAVDHGALVLWTPPKEDLLTQACPNDWKTTRVGTKAKWDYAEVQALAKSLFENLPDAAKALLGKGEFKGGRLTCRDSKKHAALSLSRKDVKNNIVW
eukprot:5886154-Karenia_brevis.AAC.1